ncbi:MAG: BamA/TamA family outer membrane protein [Calditrichia bacterium]
MIEDKYFRCFVLTLFIIFSLLQGKGLSSGTSRQQESGEKQRSLSLFPILMYDSDIGFGFGGKGILKNQFHRNESFDLILFASTKGEQWYVFTFSIPDFEIRQGSAYPFAVDVRFSFDKLLKSNFFGFGNTSMNNDWQFPREMSKLELTIGRGFTHQFITEAGLVANYSSVYGYRGVNPLMHPGIPGEGENLISYFWLGLRLDSRDSQIHPRGGWRVWLKSDFAGKFAGSDFAYQRYRLEVSNYRQLFGPAHIFAWRLWAQQVDGTAPYYEQSIIGGGWTARGFKADRFIENAMILSSAEYRLQFIKRLGAVVFVDTGRVFPDMRKASFKRWKADVGFGLRYYLANFVVRFDSGFSNEGTRIFFNFGHVF